MSVKEAIALFVREVGGASMEPRTPGSKEKQFSFQHVDSEDQGYRS
jgi:hypothetical protein